jgi:hypothetical protein
LRPELASRPPILLSRWAASEPMSYLHKRPHPAADALQLVLVGADDLPASTAPTFRGSRHRCCRKGAAVRSVAALWRSSDPHAGTAPIAAGNERTGRQLPERWRRHHEHRPQRRRLIMGVTTGETARRRTRQCRFPPSNYCECSRRHCSLAGFPATSRNSGQPAQSKRGAEPTLPHRGVLTYFTVDQMRRHPTFLPSASPSSATLS